ncbi:DUF697 domain-containing protein [Hydrocarboniclastica marina]|uniref:DUF697 domain-containing protein n=2 Tax=Hydrocarboniclastica marina TaxID=2259620 RepID=A0A4P7XCY0_9ALTE|nr:DUF697 domain-containing protein [Hydrocarboniclastica marina]
MAAFLRYNAGQVCASARWASPSFLSDVSMKLPRPLRLIAFWLLVLVVLAVLVFVVNQLLTLQIALESRGDWQGFFWWGLIAAVVVTVLFAGWRLLLRSDRAGPTVAKAPDEESLRLQISDWEERGLDVSAPRAELAELDRRRASTAIRVAVFGEMSTGKSSLIRALVPGATVETGVLGGTTQDLTVFHWQSPAGDQLELVDCPGFNQGTVGDSRAAREEAQRAHLVLFVGQGDLARGEWHALELLLGLDKPMVVALNKSDHYSDNEQKALKARLADRLPRKTPVVSVIAGGQRERVRRLADGTENRELVERPADLRELRRALQAELDRHAANLGTQRDNAVFLLTASKLHEAVSEQRQDAADALVERYARRAVFGALAAVAPGSDLVIQGALISSLVRELTALYNLPVRQVNVEQMVALLRKRGGAAVPLLFGVAGNAAKAFPGIGTLAGGLVHGVAYGLLFRAIGQALVQTLNEQGDLQPDLAARHFEEVLSGDLGSHARSLARLALESGPAGPADVSRADAR